MPLGGEEMNSGYKGYGLGMVVELLTGIMAGGQSAYKIRKWATSSEVANLGHFFLAVDPNLFAPGMPARLTDLMQFIRGRDPVDPDLKVLVPGDPERMAMKKVDDGQSGRILYTSNHIYTYQDLARKLDVKPLQSS